MIDMTNFINHALLKPTAQNRRQRMYNLRTDLDHDDLVKLMSLIRGRDCSRIGSECREILERIYAAFGYSIKFPLDNKGRVTARISQNPQGTSIGRVPIPVPSIASTRSREQVLELYNLLTGQDAKNITENVLAVIQRVFNAIGYTAGWDGKTLKLN
jgi:hypothetical protein